MPMFQVELLYGWVQIALILLTEEEASLKGTNSTHLAESETDE